MSTINTSSGSANTQNSSAINFHVLADNGEEAVYYTAVADPRPHDRSIVLNYEKQNISDPKNEEKLWNLFYKQGLGFPFSNPNIVASAYACRNWDDSNPVPYGHFDQIRSVFVTCALSSPLGQRGEPHKPSMFIPITIGQQCQQAFPEISLEHSFFKVTHSYTSYNATSEFERAPMPPNRRFLPNICTNWKEL